MAAEKKLTIVERSDKELKLSRIFDAPRELVWDAWTHAEHLAQWWGPDGFRITTHSMEVKPGGVWRFIMHGPDGRDYPNQIQYHEVLKPERLVYHHGGEEDHAGVSFNVRVQFEAMDGKTRIEMRMAFESKADLDHVIKNFGALEGAQQTMGRLEEFLKGANRHD